MADQAAARLVLTLADDPVLTRELLFAHRHPIPDAPFHPRMVAAYTSRLPKVLVKAFRASAKSTTAEEVMTQMAAFGQFRYGLIVGSTYDRAVDRLKSIKRELGFNEKLLTMFGGVEGDTWGADTITLTNGVMIKAMGHGQSVRGLKEAVHNSRPDFVFFDDLEEEETGSTAKRVDGLAIWTWIYRVLLPALADGARVRWGGTPLGEGCALEMAAASPDWRVLTIPLYTGTGEEIEPTWPARFSVARCLELRDEYIRAGDLAGFTQEYLCTSTDDQARTFHAEDFKVEAPRVSFAPKTLIVDPARTTGPRSSQTGYVVTSWLGARLVVHEAQGAHHTPAEQVARIFELAATHRPVSVAVEADGLEQWLTQPLRAGMTERGVLLPLEPIRAPQDKDGFIKGLQPFFAAHEVVFAKPFPELQAQLLAFPHGKKDIANALAYALRLRPGQPVYPAFSEAHVGVFVPGVRSSLWLCLNAQPGIMAAVLVAVQDGALHVLADWVREGAMAEILQMVNMDLNSHPLVSNLARPQVIIPAERASATDGAGLGQMLLRSRVPFVTGKRTVESVEGLTSLMRTTIAGRSQITVNPDAEWTLNALAGGYMRRAIAANVTMPVDNLSKLVAQALECLAAKTAAPGWTDEDEGLTMGRNGRQFRSMLR